MQISFSNKKKANTKHIDFAYFYFDFNFYRDLVLKSRAFENIRFTKFI